MQFLGKTMPTHSLYDALSHLQVENNSNARRQADSQFYLRSLSLAIFFSKGVINFKSQT
jgi:hypothetical protein